MSTEPLRWSTFPVSTADLESIGQTDNSHMLGRALFQNLSFRDLSSLAITSPSIRSVVEKHLSETVESYKQRPQVLPKTREEDIFDSCLEKAIKETNRFLPVTAADSDRNKKICQVFSNILQQLYPTASFSLDREGILQRLIQIEKTLEDNALIDFMNVIFPDTVPSEDLIEGARRTHLEDILTLVAAEEPYQTVPFERIEPLITPEIATRLSANFPPNVLNAIPAVFVESESFPNELTLVLRIILWSHQTHAVTAILSLPENSPEEIAEKAKLLRNLLKDRLFDFTAFIYQLDEKSISRLPREFLRLTEGSHTIALDNNSLSQVPLISNSVTELNLSNNPLRDFKNLSRNTALTALNLSSTGLTQIPRELEAIRNLTDLSLAGNKLISLTSDLDISREADFDDNPLFYVAPEVLENYSFFEQKKQGFYAEQLYQPLSAFGMLTKHFMQPEENYNTEEIRPLLLQISEEYRNKVYEYVWKESGEPRTVDAQWGEHHAFDDLAILARAVKETIESYDLPHERAETLLNAEIYYSNSPATVAGENNVTLPLAAHADALSNIDLKSHPQALLFSWQLSFVQNCWELYQEAQDYTTTQENPTHNPAALIRKKCLLRSQWEALLKMLNEVHEALPSSTLMPSFVAESFQSAEAACPEAIKNPSIPELITERHAIIPPGLNRGNYEGDFDLEVSYRPSTRLGEHIHNLLDLDLEPYIPQSFFFLGKYLSKITSVFSHFANEQLWLPQLQAMARAQPDIYGQVLHTTVQELFEELSAPKKSAVYAKVYELAGRPATDDLEWGQHHASDCLSRLADAIVLVDSSEGVIGVPNIDEVLG